MQEIFYNNNSSTNTLRKSITQLTSASITLKDDTELIRPTIILSNNLNVNFNYVYINELNRYYFVQNKRYGQQRIYVDLNVDVLESFRSDILNLDVIAERSSNVFNTYQADGVLPKTERRKITTQPFPNGFSGQSLLLAVSGGD